jgi:tetratricopeptide (TPR) repeat protein
VVQTFTLKKQFILAAAGLFLVSILFFFGRTTSNKKTVEAEKESKSPEKTFDIQQFIAQEKAKLSPDRVVLLSTLENSVSRGDVLSQQIKANEALANFWKDSVNLYEPYAFYTSLASKLVNSEKNLTFAARIFLGNLRREKDEAKLGWETKEAIDLFERAIKLNPNNDDLRIGLGSAYIYGKGRNGNPNETMQGILELVNVVKRDSTNMKAQLMVGVGGLVSGQFDKAIVRLQKVVTAQPDNAEAVAYLADAYAGQGNKAEAIKWYTVSKRLINDPHYTEEVDARIKTLR